MGELALLRHSLELISFEVYVATYSMPSPLQSMCIHSTSSLDKPTLTFQEYEKDVGTYRHTKREEELVVLSTCIALLQSPDLVKETEGILPLRGDCFGYVILVPSATCYEVLSNGTLI